MAHANPLMKKNYVQASCGHWKNGLLVSKLLRRVLTELSTLFVLVESEVGTQLVGEAVMVELRQLDEVAYVRFASVYRSFKDLNEFRAEIERLEQEHQGN